MRKLLMLDSDGVKSIPLNAFPAEAWQSLDGTPAGGSGRLMLFYENVPWLFRGVNARADAVARLPLAWEINNQEIEDYELPFDLNIPQFLNEIEGDLTLFGAAYIWLDIDKPTRARKPARLYPGSIRPIYDSAVGLKGFERIVGGQKVMLSLKEVGYIWQPNRKKELGPGSSPGQAALHAAGALTHIDLYVEKFFEQGTISPVIIGIEDATEDGDVSRLEAWFKRRLTGIANAFGAVAVRGSVKPHVLMQNDLEKLSLEPLNNQKREDIATALGVPQTMLFSTANASYATANQDAFNWYEMTIIPEAMRIEQRLNGFLFEPVGVSCIFKPERLEIYQEREADKAFKMTALYDRAIVTKNEVRVQAGWSSLPDGDSFVEAESEDEYDEDLRRWQTKALKRFKEGKPLDFEFRSTVIPPDVITRIRSMLENCQSSDAIRGAFSNG